jgi:hypothetical protein
MFHARLLMPIFRAVINTNRAPGKRRETESPFLAIQLPAVSV